MTTSVYRVASIILIVFILIDIERNDNMCLFIDAFALGFINLHWYLFHYRPSRGRTPQVIYDEIAKSEAEKKPN